MQKPKLVYSTYIRTTPKKLWAAITEPERGLELVEREAGNFVLPAYPGPIIKDSYWRWPERNLAGNAIDFHVQVLGLSFHDAMRQITGT